MSKRRFLQITIVAVLAAVVLAVCAIAYRNYRGAQLDFEPSPPNALLRQPAAAGVEDCWRSIS